MNEMPGGGIHDHHSPSEEIQHLGHNTEASEKLIHAVNHLHDENVLAQNAQELEEKQKKFLRTIKIEAFAIPIITVLGVALSIGASTYWNSKHQHIAHLYTLAQEIKEDIDSLYVARNNLMDAMIQIRAVRDIGQAHCRLGEYAGPDKIAYKEKLYASGFKLVNAAYNTTGMFNDEIDKEITRFTYLADIDRIGVCQQGASTDKDFRILQRNINMLILQDVNNLKLKREKILKNVES